jgi:hypothetical protein
VCQFGASWVRTHVLEEHPHAKLTLLAVWLPMLGGDSKAAINRRMFDDPRAINFWDPDRIAGDWFGRHAVGGLGGGGYTVWDAFYGFRSSARWTSTPTDVVATGSDIIGNTAALDRKFVPLLR